MCGVVSIIYKNDVKNIGKEAVNLLKKLEYRGYDSTGASFINDKGDIQLMKKVGAPSIVTQELEIGTRVGQRFIGQVRWATYGAVTDNNAQPHRVSCKYKMVGAHNGNISNTDSLKVMLGETGHRVLSDNDGEMLVHVIEHYFAEELAARPAASQDEKIALFKKAIRRAQQRVIGSYASCVAAPDIPGIFAIKSGSSLYAGKGEDENGEFIVVSSDLTSVLSKTRFLIPLAEGEAIYFTENDYTVFSLSDEREHKPGLKRSRLNIADISLQPKYAYFMEQEIASSSANIDMLMKYYLQDEDEKELHRLFEENYQENRGILYELIKLYDIFEPEKLKKALNEILQDKHFTELSKKVLTLKEKKDKNYLSEGFTSEDALLLNELLGLNNDYMSALYVLDLMIIWKKKRTILKYKKQLLDVLNRAREENSRIYLVASGTSHHASLLAGHFFNNIAGFSAITVNPGQFRSAYINSLGKGDIFIGVSQSGETKDLVDIYNDIRAKYSDEVLTLSIVNNENSTIPQEKSRFYLPILCGPEIAVAATKSFISQIALFYLIALELVHKRQEVQHKLEQIRSLIDLTNSATDESISKVALKIFMKPSIHILGTSLIGLAKEGALKIREIVLNHTEGYDSAEFKHGPNTILGKNTLFSFKELEWMYAGANTFYKYLLANGSNTEARDKFLDLMVNYKFGEEALDLLSARYQNKSDQEFFRNAYEKYKEIFEVEDFFSNYPLIFVCPPNERDIRITISQIHTHKIRGADIIVIAEDNEELRKAAEGLPAALKSYYNQFIKVPATGNEYAFVFAAAIVLQQLSLKMSILKRKYLNRYKVENHGVHPDVPKNVSKSITVD